MFKSKKLLERLLGLEELDEIYECAASDRDERSIFWARPEPLRACTGAVR